MNNHPLEIGGLRSPDGREAQLLSVQIHAELLGLMLKLTVRQTWRNVSGAPMAAHFSLPLGWDQTLLSLQALRGGETLTPQRIERDSRQRCSVALGLMGTGEQIAMVWRIGQLLHLEGGSVRVALPALLAPHAPYPVQLEFEVHDPVAQGTVSCTSHDLHRVRHARGTTLRLKPRHSLDKDLVLHVHGLRDKGFAVASPDGTAPGRCTVLVSGHVHLPETDAAPGPVRMKLLVDSSSAMPAERLGQIHGALDRVLARLGPEDQLSFSRFGDSTVHDLPRLQACTPAYQRRVRTLARHTDSDLGTAQVEAALQQVLAIPDEDEEAVRGAAIVLITASPFWAVEPMLRSLRAADHSLYVLAVGAAAGLSLWQELAGATGGLCERLAPGQHVEPHLNRLIAHLRAQTDALSDLRIEGAQLLARAQGPSRLCDGQTLHLWAGVQPDQDHQDLVGCPELQASLAWQRDEVRARPVTLTPVPVLWDESGDLTRLCAAQEALRLDDPHARQAILLRHGLVWPDASRLMASAPTPALAAPAAGQHHPVVEAPRQDPAQAMAQNHSRTASVQALPPRRPATSRQADLASCLQDKTSTDHPLYALVQGFNAQAATRGQFRAALSATLHAIPIRWLDGLVLHLSRRAGNPGRVWALMLHWLHVEHDMALSPQALQLLEQELATMPVSARNEVTAALNLAAQVPATRQAA